MYMNMSAYGEDDCSSGQPCTMGVGSPLTGGSSGGPWLLADVVDGVYVNGLNSYGYDAPACTQNMYSPYFSQNTWTLYQAVKGQ
jgi:hypothetical protein